MRQAGSFAVISVLGVALASCDSAPAAVGDVGGAAGLATEVAAAGASNGEGGASETSGAGGGGSGAGVDGPLDQDGAITANVDAGPDAQSATDAVADAAVVGPPPKVFTGTLGVSRSDFDGTLDLYAQNQEGVWHSSLRVVGNGPWTAWEGLGGAVSLLGPPAPVVFSDGSLEVLAVSSTADGTVYHRDRGPGSTTWSGWDSLGSGATTAPAACAHAGLDFAAGSGIGLRSRLIGVNANPPNDWYLLNSGAATEPDSWPAIVCTPGGMVVFVQQIGTQAGTANVLGMRFDYPNPQPPLPPASRATLEGSSYSAAVRNWGVTAAFWPGSATIDVFSMRGSALGHDGFASDVSGRIPYDNVPIVGVTSMVAAVATSPTAIELFGLSAQRTVLRATMSSGVLGPWSPIGI